MDQETKKWIVSCVLCLFIGGLITAFIMLPTIDIEQDYYSKEYVKENFTRNELCSKSRTKINLEDEGIWIDEVNLETPVTDIVPD